MPLPYIRVPCYNPINYRKKKLVPCTRYLEATNHDCAVLNLQALHAVSAAHTSPVTHFRRCSTFLLLSLWPGNSRPKKSQTGVFRFKCLIPNSRHKMSTHKSALKHEATKQQRNKLIWFNILTFLPTVNHKQGFSTIVERIQIKLLVK